MKKNYHMDSEHLVVNNVVLAAGAKLHRFMNCAGCPYSAIYYKGEEVWSCERGHEEAMVREWNASKRNAWVKN